MTRATWAERQVEGLEFIAFMNNGEVPVCESKDAVKALLAEHRRAVRVVRRELEKYQRRRECETNASRRDMLGGAILACSNILAALQKGRT